MEATIQIRSRGTITLPASLRERYALTKGDVLRLIDFEGVFVLTPLVPMVPELARQVEQLRQEAGLSVDELLEGIREQRARYAQEKSGDAPED